MPSCVAINCCNRFEKGFRLFRLPADEHRKKQWLVNMGRETWKPASKSAYLCEMHFDDSQYEQNRADGWKKLKPNAIPTLFNIPMVSITVHATDVFRLCRICLSVNDSLINLFKPISNNQLPYLELMEHTSLQVSSDDNLPPYICKECFDTLQSMKKFKEKCIHSDNLLKNYNGPNTLENLIEYIISKTKVEGIWYIHNEDDSEISTVDKPKHTENKQPLIDEIKEKLDKLDEFLDKQKEILEQPVRFVQTISNNCLKKVTFIKKQVQPTQPPAIHLSSDNPHNLSQIKLPKASWISKYEIKEFVCHICGKKIKDLDSHVKIHNSEFQYNCEICGKQFRQTALLRKHLVVHKIEKNFKCSICHMAFTRAQVRNRHIHTVHGGTRRFKCTVCPKSFHLAYRLKVHMVTHTDERRYKCDIEGCTREYRQRTPLVMHKQKYHSNNDQNVTFICTICGKVFKEKQYLASHMRLHDVNDD